MPSPKSGSAGSIVAPAEPTVADDADVADPGEVAKVKAEQIQSKEGKYGSVPIKPHTKKNEEEKKDDPQTSWIELELVDEEGKPVAGESYAITLPDGSVSSGTLDQKGSARVEGIDAGTCKITFPDRDKNAWN